MQSKYNRAAPSPRYRRLLEQYRQMHLYGETHLGIPPEKTFPGASLPKEAEHIKRWIKQTDARTLLDYGCGKGRQYWPLRIRDHNESVEYADIKSYWGITDVRCYDPAYSPFSELPAGEFDGVICTDVLEHCPEEDIPWILVELFSYARKFVYANVACFPARKRLPSGANAHCTIKPVGWWEKRVSSAGVSKPGTQYEFRFAYPKGDQLKLHVLSSAKISATP